MWKFEINKQPKGLMELTLTNRLREMAKNTYATNAYEFESNFKRVLEEEMPIKNDIRAWHMFKLTQTNIYKVEIWKLDIEGDFKHKLYTLTFDRVV